MTDLTNGTAANIVFDTLLANSRVLQPTWTPAIGADRQRARLANCVGDHPLPLPQIVEETKQLLSGWPKVVDGILMVPSDSNGLCELKSPASLFAHIAGVANTHWRKGANLPTKEEFFQRMIQQCEQFASIELFPHHHPKPNTLYHHRPLPAVRHGTLDELLRHFAPATMEDASLLRAFVCTLFWGGSAGSRPLFVFTNDSHDRSDRGRGIGKSIIISELSGLCGGLIDADSNTDIGKLETRLLSSGARDKRIVRIDNVKSERLSWAGLERLITASVISAHRMYAGDGARPNNLTYTMTVNGVSVSEDLASRAAVIELTRPENYRPSWQQEVRQFVDQNRWLIIAEIIDILNGCVPNSLQGHQRLAEWEAEVLARQPNAQRALDLLQTRRGEIDGDAETVQTILDELIKQYGGSGRVSNRIETSTMVDLVKAATGQDYHRNKVKMFLDRLRITGLTHHRVGNQRFFRWDNPNARGLPTAPSQNPD